ICNSLAENGYAVKIIGRRFKNSPALEKKNYQQKRLQLFFKKGFGFYFEYNLKLFFYLLFQKTDILCCIDLDTILPVYFVSVLKNKTRVYDAHEYFSQLKEIITRPKIYRVWHFILKNYEVKYEVIRNVPLLKPVSVSTERRSEKIILYQGSVNEGRGFEYLIPAMKNINAVLHIYGDGNFLEQAKKIAVENQVQEKVFFKGKFLPNELNLITAQAYIGINLVDAFGKNQLLSLANKFFDYIQNEVPQVTMDFPEYKRINNEYEVALLLEKSLKILLENETLYFLLKQNCIKALAEYNWQNEEKKLINFYKKFDKKP